MNQERPMKDESRELMNRGKENNAIWQKKIDDLRETHDERKPMKQNKIDELRETPGESRPMKD